MGRTQANSDRTRVLALPPIAMLGKLLSMNYLLNLFGDKKGRCVCGGPCGACAFWSIGRPLDFQDSARIATKRVFEP